MSRRSWRAAGPVVLLALVVVLAGCGGGFSSAQPPPPDRAIRSYVALGDGFTAAPYTGTTAGDDGCLRSKVNYPALTAEELGIGDVKDVSCTGATTAAVTGKFKPGKGKPALPAQLDAVDKDTDLVSIGMGIEDGDLLKKMFAVCSTQPCAPGTVEANAALDAVQHAADAVTDAIRAVQAKSPNVYVVVVGYPKLTPPPDAACDAYPKQPTLSVDGGTEPVSYLVDDLNAKLRTAALQTGSAYVDVAELSADHTLCTAQPWVHDQNDKPGKAVAYHPVAAEQRAVADQVVTEVKER